MSHLKFLFFQCVNVKSNTLTPCLCTHIINAACVGGLPAPLLLLCNLNISTFLTYLVWVNYSLIKMLYDLLHPFNMKIYVRMITFRKLKRTVKDMIVTNFKTIHHNSS